MAASRGPAGRPGVFPRRQPPAPFVRDRQREANMAAAATPVTLAAWNRKLDARVRRPCSRGVILAPDDIRATSLGA